MLHRRHRAHSQRHPDVAIVGRRNRSRPETRATSAGARRRRRRAVRPSKRLHAHRTISERIPRCSTGLCGPLSVCSNPAVGGWRAPRRRDQPDVGGSTAAPSGLGGLAIFSHRRAGARVPQLVARARDHDRRGIASSAQSRLRGGCRAAELAGSGAAAAVPVSSGRIEHGPPSRCGRGRPAAVGGLYGCLDRPS